MMQRLSLQPLGTFQQKTDNVQDGAHLDMDFGVVAMKMLYGHHSACIHLTAEYYIRGHTSNESV